MRPHPFPSGLPMRQRHQMLDRRHAERVPFQVRVLYASEDGTHLLKADGMLTDLSKSGCKITSSIAPAAGCSITLFLYLSDNQPPLCLTQATVSWVHGSSFAARFPDLSREERARLQKIIWRHATLLPAKVERAAYRIL